jgi:hypothetical protein
VRSSTTCTESVAAANSRDFLKMSLSMPFNVDPTRQQAAPARCHTGDRLLAVIILCETFASKSLSDIPLAEARPVVLFTVAHFKNRIANWLDPGQGF